LPPAGISLAAFLVLGHRAWPGILVGAYLVTRFANGRYAFEPALDVFKFAALAAVIGPAAAATIAITSLCLTGSATWTDFGGIWLTWWLGE
jgi:integral membrane sensor domain MASE1